MEGAPKILVVRHSRSGGTAALADAVVSGVAEGCAAAELRVREPLVADVDDVRWSDGIILGSPTHFGYMSGQTKDFFERIFRPLSEETAGLPWGLFVKGESDVDGCVASIERIVVGLRWKAILPPVKAVGDVLPAHLEAAFELGATMAAGLAEEIF